MESNFHDLCKNVVSFCVWAYRMQHLLITHSTEYRKIQKNGLNKLQQQKVLVYFIVLSVANELFFQKRFIWKKNSTEKPAWWPFFVHCP